MIEPLESENPMEWNEIWPIMECDKEMDTTTRGDKNNKFKLANIPRRFWCPLNLSFL